MNGWLAAAALAATLAVPGPARPQDASSLELAERLRALGDHGACTVEALRHAYLVPAAREPAFERAALCLGLAGRWQDAERLLRSLPQPGEARTRYRLCWLGVRTDGPGDACGAAAGGDRLALLAGELPVVHALRLGRWAEAKALLARPPPTADLTLSSWRALDAALAERGLSRPRHSPLLAGALSAVVPGLGRMYVGRWNDGLMSMVLIGVPAGFAANGFARHGAGSVRGWLLGSLAGVLYLGNVYGSAAGAALVDAEADRKLRAEADELHLSRAEPSE